MFLSTDVYDVKFYLSSDMMKFISTFLCLIISIISNPIRQSKNIFLLQLGLIFTSMADYVFLIHGENFSIAIGLFSIVQIIYSFRYREGNEFKRIVKYGAEFIVVMLVYKFIWRYYKIDFLIAIGTFYGICLISSLKDAIYLYKNNPYSIENRMILLAMILFFMCDFSLGIHYILDKYLLVKNNNPSYIINLIMDITSISIWGIYLPSQILLALSGSDNNIMI